MSQHPTTDSKYIQQHLANERTYLAWIRTSITIIGIGFLITNLHFSSLKDNTSAADLLARVIGLASIFVGLVITLASTISYYKKGKAINSQTFHYPKKMVFILSSLLVLILLSFCIYYVVVWKVI